MQVYSDQEREEDEHALPDAEVFELTAEEAALLDEDRIYEYSSREEHRLCFMNSKARAAMIDAIIAEEGLKGGWYYQYCFPGCLPDSEPYGPYDTKQDAIDALREEFAE